MHRKLEKELLKYLLLIIVNHGNIVHIDKYYSKYIE